MTKRQQQMLQNLKQFADGSFDWCYGSVDFDAIKFVLSEIERLTTENRRMQGEVDNNRRKQHDDWD
jgi:hypothetical protein